MDTYWCQNCNDYVTDRSKPQSLADASCPHCKKKGLRLFNPNEDPLDAIKYLFEGDDQIKQEVPEWFEGAIYEEGKNIINPRTGEKIYLTNIEASIYDVGNGAQMTYNDIKANRETGLSYLKTFSNLGVTQEQVISHLKSTIENASNWLKINNISAYEILRDIEKYDTWNKVITQSPKKLFITQYFSSRSIKALLLIPFITVLYSVLFEAQGLPFNLLSINGSLLLIISTPFLLTFVFKRISIIQSIVSGIINVSLIGNFIEGGFFWVSIASSLIVLLTFMYRYDERSFLDIESNPVTQIKSRFMDCSTGTFIGVLLASLIKLIFF